jgi:hypothetical protein
MTLRLRFLFLKERCYLRTKVQLAESIQELLDAGMTRNRVARILRLNHEVVNRIIKSRGIETYVAFDEGLAETSAEVDFLDYEDAIDRDIETLWNGGRLDLSQKDASYRRYIVSKYGGIFECFLRKGVRPLLEQVYKTCGECRVPKPLLSYSRHPRMPYGLAWNCKSCAAGYVSKWMRNNPEAKKAVRHNRLAIGKNLIATITESELVAINETFLHACCLTGSTNKIHLDHFVALNTGHGGSYFGNLVPIRADLNIAKSDRNPFVWAQSKSASIRKRLRHVVACLADLNGMSVTEYTTFVNWCYDNRRSIAQIRSDNAAYGYIVDSRDLWRASLTNFSTDVPIIDSRVYIQL